MTGVTAEVVRDSMGIATIARIAALAVLVPLGLLTIWIWCGLSRPSPVLVLEGFQMWLLVPAWIIAAAAIVRRDWLVAVPAALVAGSHLAFCLPAATADAVPGWVEGAPTASVFVANVRYDNPDPGRVAEQVRRADADIVVLNEMTPVLFDELERVGVLERYPTQVSAVGRPFGELLLTRLPARVAEVETFGGSRVPAATVTIDGQDVRVLAVHVQAPKNAAQRHPWRRNLDGLGHAVESRQGVPMLLLGDFNSAPWHGPFRRLLSRGLTDSHDALGQGLSRSWTADLPGLGLIGPVMRLDHALFTPGLFPLDLSDVEVPGSDHRGFRLRIAVETTSG